MGSNHERISRHGTPCLLHLFWLRLARSAEWNSWPLARHSLNLVERLRRNNRVKALSNVRQQEPLGLEENKAVVLRSFQYLSEGDPTGAAALYSPKFLNHGREVSREDLQLLFETIVGEGEKFDIKEMIAEGDWVACRAIVTGKHGSRPKVPGLNHGVNAMVEPNGVSYTVQHIHVLRVVDGQIVEHWANRDDLDEARQLGLELAPAKK